MSTPTNTQISTHSATIHRERIEALRQKMRDLHIDALIIPSADPHMSEYLPEYWQARQWFSGFTGSMGTLVVLQDFAGLWTDSRYWVQAAMELMDTGIQLQKITAGAPSFAEFLMEKLPTDATVAIDGAVLSVAQYDTWHDLFKDKLKLVTQSDIVAQIWQDRPPLPKASIYPHPKPFVSQSCAQKLAKVRAQMRSLGVQAHLISSLDDIAWLTNLRGADVSFNPVFLAHLFITQEAATLFVDADKLQPAAVQLLSEAQIEVADYADIGNAIAKISGALLIDAARVAIGTLASLNPSVKLIYATNPTTKLKAVKDEAEIAHIREAMRQDGAALCEFFAQFEQAVEDGVVLTEFEVGEMLHQARSRQAHYVSPSFDTIAGFGANGAIVHYRADKASSRQLLGDGLLLIDSGGQYHNGTTDITRMVGIGRISQAQKQDVTDVLKAHIALASAHFPENLPAGQLDVLARAQLWRQGLDYGHGTGHGVGYFLNVHEGPQSISPSALTAERAMQAGMITTNEPGLYREGQWGIRLENCLLSVPAGESEFGKFLRFESLTLCPFDTRLLLLERLTCEEKHWLNAYHRKVLEALIDRVDGAAKRWLIARTQAIA